MKRFPVRSHTILASMVLLGSTFATTSLRAQSHSPLIDPIPAGIPSSNLAISLQPILSGLVQPTAGAVAPGDADHLYIADQIGQVWSVDVSRHPSSSSPHVILDIRSLIIPLGLGPAKYDERGLLGIAFHPGFRHNHLFYTYSSQAVKGAATFSTLPPNAVPNCQNVLQEWQAVDLGEDNFVIDPSSAREILRVDKPQFNHNGGALVFGPDRLLYLSVGDGGGANDFGVGHAQSGNAQTLAPGNVLGKILRINPLGHNSANGQYGIPADNPFLNSSLAPGAQPEIYAYGFRNPWRMSFDSKTGALYAGDVGQNDIEEVDVVQKGMNYGWPIKEGTFLFDGFLPGRGGTGYVWQDSPGSPSGLVDPIAEYDHGDGEVAPLHSGTHTRQAIIGGFVYRGDRAEALEGKYIFGDYGSATSPIQGHLFTLNGNGNRIEELHVQGRSTLNLAVLGFAQGHDGELYLLASQTGTVLGSTGVVMRIGDGEKGRDGRDKEEAADRK